jgi:DNA invertase Pin-like site-specific DNA recombinase
MLTDKLKALQALKQKAAALEAQLVNECNASLAQLPAEYGFDDVNAFAAAVLAASGKGGSRRGRKPGVTVAATGGKKRRHRAIITDATRAEVKKLVQAGKTGAEIAKTVGISLPSVQNIKKALGLVQKRK